MRTLGWVTFSGEQFKLKFVEHAGEVVFAGDVLVRFFVGFIILKRDLGDLNEGLLGFFNTDLLVDSDAGPLEVCKLSFVESFWRFGKMFSK